MTTLPDDPPTVIHDGQIWHSYIIDFRHDGKTYSFNIYALDLPDANRRLRSIRGNAEVIGELGGEIAVNEMTAPVVRIWVAVKCWWRNLFV
jgi:hypothetical protein